MAEPDTAERRRTHRGTGGVAPQLAPGSLFGRKVNTIATSPVGLVSDFHFCAVTIHVPVCVFFHGKYVYHEISWAL